MLQRTGKTLILLAALVSNSLILVSAETCHTYVNNLSSKSVHATTSYLAASSGFVNRIIAPETQRGFAQLLRHGCQRGLLYIVKERSR